MHDAAKSFPWPVPFLRGGPGKKLARELVRTRNSTRPPKPKKSLARESRRLRRLRFGTMLQKRQMEGCLSSTKSKKMCFRRTPGRMFFMIPNPNK